MTTGDGVLVVAYAAATVLGLILGFILWRHRERTGAVPMAVAAFGMVFWSGALIVATVVDDYGISAFMHRILFVGVGIAVLGAFLFKLEYTGREHLVTRSTIALLSIEPIAVVALVFWNPRNLFFESFGPDPAALTGVAVEWGVAFDVHLVYSYALSIVGTAMILEFLYNSRALYRGQAAALFAGSLVPLAMNAFHIFTDVGADTTPIGFAVVSVLYSVAIVRYRLIDVSPIARDRVLDTVSESVFVVDRDDRLIDVNPAGRRFIDGDDHASLVGRHVDELFPDPDLQRLYHDLTAAPKESSAELAYDDGYYEVYATPIDDGRDRHVGWLVLASDITEQKRREEQLREQNDRLDQFASLVSHDLRNPLTVADGYVDLARETGDLSHLDEVDRSIDRMETIIDDVLALAREGTADTDPEPVSLAQLAERAWNTVETGDASLSVDADLTLVADETRTTRLLENLFRNAVEHGSTSSPSQAQEDAVEHGSTSSQRGSRADDAGRRSASSEPSVADAPEDAVEHGSTSPDSRARQDAVEDGSTDTRSSTADESGETSVGATDPLEISVGAIGDPDAGTVDGFYVADDGVGFSAEGADRLFEDGYTTGDGTGLGLSIVAEIARGHGWAVDATSSESGGARFEFTGIETVERDDSVSTPR